MKIKFNLGWILSIAAALVLAAMGFMSFYYMNSGKTLWSIIAAACMLVIPIIVCIQLVKAKECSKPFYFHGAAVTEASMLGVMILVLVGGMALPNHFFTVNSRTKEIQDIIADQNKQYDGMTVDYTKYVNDRVGNYRSFLFEVLNNRVGNEKLYDRLFENGGMADMSSVDFMVTQLEGKISIVNDTAMPAVMSNESLRWWQLPNVMNNVDGISPVLEARYGFLVERAKSDTTDMVILQEYAEEHPSLGITVPEYWSYSYTSASDIMCKFTQTKGFISSIWAVICGLVGVLLIMLPYFVAERDSRSKGLFKELLRNEDDDDDDEIGIGKI